MGWLLLARPPDVLSIVTNLLTLLLGLWMVATLLRGSVNLGLFERVSLRVSILVYVLVVAQNLSSGTEYFFVGSSELMVVALSATSYLFLPAFKALRWMVLLVLVYSFQQWWLLHLHHPFVWQDVGMYLARGVLMLSILLVIALLGGHRSAWMRASDDAQAMQRMALTDDLTGLPNRRAAYRFFEEHGFGLAGAASCLALPVPFSALLIDIDDFKWINDQYGHAAGDQAIQAVVAALQLKLGKNGFLARWGGEELLVLLSGVGPEAAPERAEELRVAVERLILPHGPLTVSVGVASRLPRDTSEALVRRADQQLYLAKEGGKNKVMS